MNRISIKGINSLVNLADGLMENIIPESQEEYDQWVSDQYYYYLAMCEREKPFPAEKKPLINEALVTVELIINRYFSVFPMPSWINPYASLRENNNKYLEIINTPIGFGKLMGEFLERKLTDKEIKEIVLNCARISQAVVWNIGWVNLFAFQLPTLDPENSSKYLTIGKLFLGIYTVELISKYFDSFSAIYHNNVKTIDNFYETFEFQKLSTLHRVICFFEDK